jgi:DNA modification methylase
VQILHLSLSQIKIPTFRQRSGVEGEALGDLMASIESHGLLQPLVVREEGGTYTLVAGYRRLCAISNLSGMAQGYRCGTEEVLPGVAACVSLGDLDQLAAEEAELEENVRRVDLTWSERAAATARLAGLRRKKADRLGQLPPTLGDLAAEVRGSRDGAAAEETRREIILAQHLSNPEVAKAKSLKEAWQVHTRAEQVARNVALAVEVGATFGAHSHTLVQAEALGWLREAADAQFDIILTDPPYGMGAHGFGDAGGRLTSQTHKYDDSPEAWQALIGAFGAHWYRVAKPQAHLYVCCDIDGFHYARDWLTRVGWWVHRTPLINYKVDGSRVPWPEHGPQRKWEMILYAVKGRKPVNRIYSDVIETKGDDNLGHGAQKPVELFINLLKRSVCPGDAVLDCFGGTGTILLACHELQCRATCIEQDPNYYGIALKRLQELV